MQKAKTTALALTLLVLVLAVAGVRWGVCPGSPCWRRLAYTFSHASVLHALLNSWCLLLLVFGYGMSIADMSAAFAVAALVPDFCLSESPTVGMSAMLFTMMGMLALRVRRKVYFSAWVLSFIAMGYLFPAINSTIHLYCYAAGVAISLLNYPLPCRRK